MNIFLTGYMGSGKSYVGKELANDLGYKFVDTDEFLCQKESMTIEQIFNFKGEQYFRNSEFEVIKELSFNKNRVIALGGGAYVQPIIHNFITNLENVLIVYLKYDVDTLLNRLKDEKRQRPLIKNSNNLRDFIENHLASRSPFYENSNLIIDNEPDTEKIIDQIKTYLKFVNYNPSTT